MCCALTIMVNRPKYDDFQECGTKTRIVKGIVVQYTLFKCPMRGCDDTVTVPTVEIGRYKSTRCKAHLMECKSNEADNDHRVSKDRETRRLTWASVPSETTQSTIQPATAPTDQITATQTVVSEAISAAVSTAVSTMASTLIMESQDAVSRERELGEFKLMCAENKRGQEETTRKVEDLERQVKALTADKRAYRDMFDLVIEKMCLPKPQTRLSLPLAITTKADESMAQITNLEAENRSLNDELARIKRQRTHKEAEAMSKRVRVLESENASLKAEKEGVKRMFSAMKSNDTIRRQVSIVWHPDKTKKFNDSQAHAAEEFKRHME